MSLESIRKSFSQQSSLFSRSDPWLLALLLLAPLAASLPLLRHDFASAKSLEFTLAVKTLGIVHTPGYPLYLLAGKVFSLFVPLGTELWRLNFASLCFTLAAAIFLYLTCRRLHFPPVVSFASGLLLCFTPFFWQASLLARPWAFHLLLVTAVIFLTGEILGHGPWPFPKIQYGLWSFLAGATAGQHLTLMPWIFAAFLIGLAYGFPRQQAKPSDYSLSFILVSLGLVLPYLYLPIRVADPRAFWNTDFICQYASLRTSPSLSKLVSWLAWYLSGAYSGLESLPTQDLLSNARHTFAVFLRDYAFLPLVVVVLGIVMNLRRMVLEPAHQKLEMDPHARVMMALIPAIALALELTLLSGRTDAVHFTLSLAAVYWIGCGLEYCYYRLGHPQSEVPIPHAAWFGIVVVLLVPLLMGVHNYSLLLRQAHRNSPTLLNQTRHYMQTLPPHTLVAFGRTDQYFPFLYLQQKEHLRPDILLAPPSRMWPKQPYSGPAIVPAFLSSGSLFWHRTLFSQYWLEGLSQRIRTGRPSILLLPPAVSPSALDPVLEQLELTDVGLAWPAWPDPSDGILDGFYARSESRWLPTYRLQGPSLPHDAERPLESEKYLAEFSGQWRLLAKNPEQRLSVVRSQWSLLSFSLGWQWCRKSAPGRYTVRMRLVSRAPGNAVLWEGARPLGSGRDFSQVKPGSTFTDTYQWAVPQKFAAGKYDLRVAVENEKQDVLPVRGERAAKPGDSGEKGVPGLGEGYFIPVCEICVLDSEAGASSAP